MAKWLNSRCVWASNAQLDLHNQIWTGDQLPWQAKFLPTVKCSQLLSLMGFPSRRPLYLCNNPIEIQPCFAIGFARNMELKGYATRRDGEGAQPRDNGGLT